jgi:hypothetical protein
VILCHFNLIFHLLSTISSLSRDLDVDLG